MPQLLPSNHQDNSIGEDGALSLLATLEINKVVKRLNVAGNPVSEQTLYKILTQLADREISALEDREERGEGPSLTGILILVLVASYLWRRQQAN